MLKKLILVAIAALATYSFGGALVVKTTAQKPVTVILKTFKGSYIPGEVSEEIKQKCTQTISWRADDAAWLKDQFALAPSYSMIADSKRVAVRDIKKIVEAGVDAQFACSFEDTKEQVYVSATFGKTEVTVIVRGKAKKARAGLLDLFDVLVTKKQSNAAVYNFLKGVGVVGALAAAKVFLVDPWRKKYDDADLAEKVKRESERRARIEQEKKARIAALEKDDTKRKIRVLMRLEGLSYNPIDMKDLVGTWTASEELLKDLTCPQLLEGLEEKLHSAVSVWELWGPRSTAEDAVDVYQNGDWLALAVYDGHGGDQTALALAGMKKGAGAVAERGPLAQETRLLPPLVELVKQHGVAREKIVELYRVHDEKLALVPGDSGSTAIVMLINKKTLQAHFINLGDSRAVAVDGDGKVIHATKDHSPECEKECKGTAHVSDCEVKRIQDAGGFVDWTKAVDSYVRVSRAFGDFYCKRQDGGSRKYHVGIEPDIVSFDLKDASQIVLACDGVWDVVGNQAGKQKYGYDLIAVEAVGSILTRALDGGFNPAEYLCKSAIKKGSGDNISAIVVDVDVLRVLLCSTGPIHGLLPKGNAASVGPVYCRKTYSDSRRAGGAASIAVATRLKTAVDAFVFPKGVQDYTDKALGIMIAEGMPIPKMRTDSMLDPYLPFHCMAEGLYLGNNELIKALVRKRSLSLPEINTLNQICMQRVELKRDGIVYETIDEECGWGQFTEVNPQAMPKKPKLIVTLVDEYVPPRVEIVNGVRVNKPEENPEFRAFFSRGPGEYTQDGITILYYPCKEDGSNTFLNDFLPYQDVIFRKIDAALAANEIVLVHCSNGAHRSAAVVLWYLRARTEANFWRLNCLMRSKRSQVLGAHDLFKSDAPRKGNMMKEVIYRSCGIEELI